MKHALYSILIFLFILAAEAYGQITVTVTVRSPAPAQLSIWQNDPTVVQFLIINSGHDRYTNVGVSFVVTDQNNNTIVAHSDDGSPNIPRFDILPNSTLTRYGKDVVNQNAVTINSSYQDIAINTNSLPEGDYELCVKLIDQNGKEIATAGMKCSSFNVVIPDPPTLINPSDQSIVMPDTPPVFTWTPAILGGGIQAKYRLIIVPMYQNQTSKSAIEENTPLSDQTLPVNSYFYAPNNPQFTFYPTAVGFAWQVQVLDQNDQPAARNGGKSQIFTFSLDTSKIAQDTSKENPQVQEGGPCVSPCTTSKPKNTAPGGSFAVNDIIQVGLFSMSLSKVTGSGSNLTGEGLIPVPFLKAPVKVSFTNIQVNTDKQMYGGEVDAIQDNGSPVKQSIANDVGGALGLQQSDIDGIYKYSSQGARLVSALSMSTPTALPIGLDATTGNDKFVIAVIGMVFEPTTAKLNAVTEYTMPDLGPNVEIGLGTRNICFHPNGLSSGGGVLYLPGDVEYNKNSSTSFGYVFKGQTQRDSGSYVTWDCSGFKELRLKADVTFPRDWLVPYPDNNGQVMAHFVTTILKKGDWIANADLDVCTIAGADGFGLTVQSMFYDHSDIQNPPGIQFPSGYAGTTDATWHGFYIKTAAITLPQSLKTFKNSPPAISAQNLIIDGTGLTGQFLATNVFQYPEGDFGGWGASIDTIQAKFVSSSLQDGSMGGRIALPICDPNSPLIYHALLTRPVGPNGKLAFQFVIQPSGDIKADLWAATLTLDKSSCIELKDISGKFLADARLDGHLSISGLKDVPLVNFSGIKFEGFEVTSDNPYISPGTWSLNSSMGELSMAGFPVTLHSVEPKISSNGSGIGAGVAFNIELHFMGTESGIAGKTQLTIWGKMPLNSASQHFAFDKVELNSISVNAELGAVEFDGEVSLFNNDQTYGNGFRGKLSANFAKLLKVDATAQFGSVNNYRYWYVDAKALIPTGIPFPGTIIPVASIYGFIGGAWYHMGRNDPASNLHQENSNSADNSLTPGVSNSGVSYTPNPNVEFGFKAGISIGTTGGGSLFNADVTFSMQFLDGGGVKSASLDGSGYFICPSIEQRTSAMLLANVSITYDFSKSIFDGNFDVNSNPSVRPISDVSAWMNIHIDPQNWHILIGTPANELNVKVMALSGVQGYFMAGTDIPKPDPNNFPHKPEIEQSIGSKLPTVHAALPKGPVEGFAFGASLSFDTGHQCFLIVCGQLKAGAGFDIAVVHDPGLTCSNIGNPPGNAPGINGWYGIGDVYAYLQGSLELDLDFTTFSIADFGAGAVCRIMVPNPTYLQGTVGGHFSVMGGSISGHFSFTFDVGKKCEISAENPLAALDWITDMQPAEGDKDVSVFAVPSVALLFPVDQSVDLQSVDKNGGTITRTFKMEIESFTLKDSKGNTVECMPTYSSDKYIAKFTPKKDVLPGKENFTATVVVSAQEWVGSWVQAKLKNGSDAKQSKTINFTTGPRPDTLVPDQILSSYPLDRQEHFLQDEIRNGSIGARQAYIFDMPGTYVVRFIQFDSNGDKPGAVEVPCYYSNYNLRFSIPQLTNEQEYAVQVIRKTKGGNIVLASKTQQSLPWNSSVYQVLLNKSNSFQNTPNIHLNNSPSAQSVTLENVGGRAMGKMPGIEVHPYEKLLYVYYFQTSKYNTFKQKIDAMSYSKTDSWTYWDNTYRAVYPHFSTGESWDDYEAHSYNERMLDGSLVQQPPLISVYASTPNESWYNNYIWPNIYQHIQELMFSRQWNVPLSDNFNLWFGLVNFGKTVEFTGNSSGKLGVASSSQNSQLISLLMRNRQILNRTPPDIVLHYLHPEQIPADYFALWLQSHSLAWIYSQDNIQIPAWMQQLASIDMNHYAGSYKQLYDDYYSISFIYGPKFTWDSNGPWVKKQFTFGNPIQIHTISKPKPIIIIRRH